MAGDEVAPEEGGDEGGGDDWSFDLFASAAPPSGSSSAAPGAGGGGGEAEDAADDDDESLWELVEWAPSDPVLPTIIIHRQLAQCWASARMLAEWLLGPGRPMVSGAGLCVELGASLGLPTLAASLAGGVRCIATDLYPSGRAEAMEATIRRNRRATSSRPAAAAAAADAAGASAVSGADMSVLFEGVSAQRLNWFEAPEALGALCGAADVVLCADVIYERRAAPAIARAAAAALRPGGQLVFASRYGRVGLADFLEAASIEGFLPRSEAPLQSERLGLGLTEEDTHGLWLFEKSAG